MRFPIAALLCLAVLPAAAQETAWRPSHCISLVDHVPGVRVIPAGLSEPLPEYTVQIGYIDHSMFVIRDTEGHTIVTDYAGYLGDAGFVPEVATMNKGHSSHWTSRPDPRIPHVLPGWTGDGSPADHYLQLGNLLVRSVSTDIRGYGGTEANGNAIFVFETEGLCIGHLGHLHHEPTPAQYAALGRLDVLMVPVDGGLTLDLPTMIRVVERLRSSVVLPMHWFSGASLEAFLAGLGDGFAVDRRAESFMQVSLSTLPPRPTVVVLEPRLIEDDN
ncbi:MBL fold metallo-hydrolase [Mangrovicoccus algicola]|uniref:MBL fold metallo-hydrolase n=1 Tax=Mangrovicoccus algicola TaxID=2771008 RepID=A0A8J6Z500_9RHOB|nr:MBL fold metallo-hydrolase [Mangrovicoccus algicola]MBE3637779.1 MBL fold metallo-hydrolase [Mangrovicoccus algicola]